MTSYVFLADGFEEVEALAPVDIFRRAGIDVKTVSINATLEVTGAHGITVKADILYDEIAYVEADWLILPGGMPGATNLKAHQGLCSKLLYHSQKGGKIAAICASPAVVLGQLGILKGYTATCYPGFEPMMEGCNVAQTMVAVDNNIITAKGPAAAYDFGLTILSNMRGYPAALEVARGMLLKENDEKSEYYY